MQRQFGKPIYTPSLNALQLKNSLTLALVDHPNAIIMLMCDDIDQPNSHIETLLEQCSTPILGGICPSIIVGEEVKQSGALFVPVYAEVDLQVVDNIHAFCDGDTNLQFNKNRKFSLLVFVDGLSSCIDDSLTQLFQLTGNDVPVFGGGLGSLSLVQKQSVFSPNGMHKDAMILLAIYSHWEVSVAHGWEILDGPFLASEVDQNILAGLNFEPAMRIYEKVVEKFDDRKFTENDFFDIAQNYPFGLDRLDDDLLVRDPLKQESGKIVCVGKIPDNTMLYILHGTDKKMIEATSQAVEAKCDEGKATEGIVFDCISRQLFLKEDFHLELEGMAASFHEPSYIFGALAMGEIASSIAGGINFHNKTAVMGIAK